MQPCPLCGGRTRSFLESTDRGRGIGTDVFFYRQCTACGLVYLANPPADLGPYYAGGYQAIPASLPELRAMAAPEKYRLDSLLPFKAGGRLVEVGPWIGLFSINARDAGFEVSTIERDPAAVAFLNEVAVIETWHSEDPASVLAEHPEAFDVVAFWHSLEHLATPWRELREAARALRPGGVLLIAIPNIASGQAEKMGARWRHLDAPRHLTFLPPDTLTSLCTDYGLEKVHLTTSDRLSGLLAMHAWNFYARTILRIGFMRRRTLPWLQGWLERRYADWQTTEGKGAGLTAVFRKPVL